jgi:hypothetical protein
MAVMDRHNTSPLLPDPGHQALTPSPTIGQLMDVQGVKPLRDISELAGVIPDDEIEDFIETIYASRNHS